MFCGALGTWSILVSLGDFRFSFGQLAVRTFREAQRREQADAHGKRTHENHDEQFVSGHLVHLVPTSGVEIHAPVCRHWMHLD